MSSSQSPVARFRSSVRLAFVASVTCSAPFDSFHASQASIVPKASSPRSARARSDGSSSSSQASLVPEKYGSRSRPVRRATSGSWPSDFSRAQKSAVRRSCHTIAGATGRPVARSQSTVVSRWFVMPTATRSAGVACARARTSAMVAACVAQISSASCSTQPERGKCCVNSRCAVATTLPSWSKRMDRELVVPWSRASTNLGMRRTSRRPQAYYIAGPVDSAAGCCASQASSRASLPAGTCSASLLRR